MRRKNRLTSAEDAEGSFAVRKQSKEEWAPFVIRNGCLRIIIRNYLRYPLYIPRKACIIISRGNPYYPPDGSLSRVREARPQGCPVHSRLTRRYIRKGTQVVVRGLFAKQIGGHHAAREFEPLPFRHQWVLGLQPPSRGETVFAISPSEAS